MKTNIIVILIGLSMAILACSKDQEEMIPEYKDKEEIIPEIPKWLYDKISIMDTARYYQGTDVTLYKWTNQYYYLFHIPFSSCMVCDFYNYKGVKFIWTDGKYEDFLKNAEKIRIVWSRTD
jgi:hypothetical protein